MDVDFTFQTPSLTQEQAKHYIKRFTDLIKEIQKSHWKEAIAQGAKNYNIGLYNLEKITPTKIREMYLNLANKYILRFYYEAKAKQGWHENELRIFTWTMLTYGAMIGVSPDQFKQQDWQFLSKFFMKKTAQICEFQYNSMRRLTEKHDTWNQDEDELLVNILKYLSILNSEKEIKNKWNQIAKEIFIRSNKNYFRTAKQCRERWNNYLDPQKIKGQWSKEQDLRLIQAVILKGKKWSCISKLMNNTRTEHMVKNRFKSLLAKQLKKHNRANNQEISIQNIQADLLKEIQDLKQSVDLESQKRESLSLSKQIVKQNQQKVLTTSFGSSSSAFNKIDKSSELRESKQTSSLKSSYQLPSFNSLNNQSQYLFYNNMPVLFSPSFVNCSSPFLGRYSVLSFQGLQKSASQRPQLKSPFEFTNLK